MAVEGRDVAAEGAGGVSVKSEQSRVELGENREGVTMAIVVYIYFICGYSVTLDTIIGS